MEEKPFPADADLERSTSRRSRKDEEGRDYICGCGKRYLSYPALYTHIKTKHEGRQPQGTQKTGANMVIKRAKLKLDEDTLKHVYSYFEKEDLRLLHELDEGCVGSVPLALRIRKESIPKEIYDCYNSLMKNQSFELTKNSSPDLVLTIYLLNVGEYVNEKLYDHFLFFAKILRNCYFEHGEEVYRMCFSQKEGPGVVAYLPNFCLEECKYIPIVCDFMVRCYIPFDYKDANLSLMELMLFDFCNWMRKRGLTYVVTTLNKDYRLENKPVLLPKPKLSPLKNGKEKELDNNMSNSSQAKKQNGEEYDDLLSENANEDDEEDIQEEIEKERALEEDNGKQGNGEEPETPK